MKNIKNKEDLGRFFQKEHPDIIITPLIYPPDLGENRVSLGAVVDGKKFRIHIEEVEK